MRSFGPRESPNLDLVRNNFTEDAFKIGGHFEGLDDSHESEPLSIEDDELPPPTLEDELWEARIE
jgi:hypothetical protein